MSQPVPLYKLSPDELALLKADLQFFRRRPERRYRLRLASRAEIKQARLLVGYVDPDETDLAVRAYVALRLLTDGAVQRVFGIARDVGEVDFDEAAARSAYARLEPQDVSAPHNVAALWDAVPSPPDMRGPAR